MQTKKIFLIRHAKSSWEFDVNDFDRDLLPIGIKRSRKIGIATQSFIKPNYEVWTSAAKRALKTAKIICEIWNFPTSKLVIKEELYTFNVTELEKIVKSCPNECENLIIFGHNNAITDFVNKFGNISILNVPTSGFVCIEFQSKSWETITKGKTDKIIFPSHI